MNFVCDGLDIEFCELSYTVNLGFRKGTKQILHEINGKFEKGKFIGIMGPSGSGKTTLLNILSGYITNTSGNILINGESNKTLLKHSSTYITQEINLQTLLTVDENMEIACKLKLGNEINDKIIKRKIDEVLNILGLTAIRRCRVSKLSGGEKKRLSIALELINNPAVMFLDEPTTGLDSLSSHKCVEHLKSLSEQGKTIICTIHQPSATLYEMFDSIYVMTEGKCLYQGKTTNLLDVLDEEGLPCPVFHNPADFVLDIANGDYGSDIIDRMTNKFNKSVVSDNQGDKMSTTNFKKEYSNGSNIHKLSILMKREFIKATRNPTLTYLRLITSITDSLILCGIFWKVGSDGAKILFNYNAILGMSLHFMMPQLMLTILTFPFEVKSLKSEYFNRWYSIKSYYISITLVDLPISVIYCLVSNFIFYYLTEQPAEWNRFWMFSLAGFLICIVAQSLGLLIGALCDVVIGTFVGSAIGVPMIIFGGIGISFKDLPPYLSWMSYLSYIGYGVEGMVVAVDGFDREKLPCNEDYCHWRYPEIFLNDLGIQADKYWSDMIILMCAFVVLRFVTYFALKRKVIGVK